MKRSSRSITLVLIASVFAILACNVPDGSEGVTPNAVDSVYATITAQAGSPLAPTNTPEPGETTQTPSPSPSVSPTPPDQRSGNGDNLSLQRCRKTIEIDGRDDEWNDQPQIPTIKLDQNTFGQNEWQGQNDASGTMRLCWIDSNLYLFVSVVDDIHVQTEEGQTAWQGDELELLFDGDLRGDFYDDPWSDDDTQLGLSPGNFDDLEENVVQYHPRDIDSVEDVTLWARQSIGVGGNYDLEAAIPWRVLRVTPQAGMNYGFCLALSDNDHVGTAQQDSMVGHCTDLEVFNPTTWTTITLIP